MSTDDANRKAKLLLDRFIDQMNLLERKCPGVVNKPGVTTRSIPDTIIQSLRTLADEASDLLATNQGERP